jgi:hypothetical protein
MEVFKPVAELGVPWISGGTDVRVEEGRRVYAPRESALGIDHALEAIEVVVASCASEHRA